MSIKSTSNILKEAKKVISDPNRWTKEAYAKTATGHRTDPNSPRAHCYCISGAVRKVIGLGTLPSYLQDTRNDQYYRVMKILDIAAASTAFKTANVIAFNDLERTSHEDMMQVIDLAIELATMKEEG